MKDPAIQNNRTQCLLALISAAIVAICVCIGVTKNLVTLYDENFDHMGIRTFCMFTVNSNILVGLSMLLCLPYAIDGLRTGNYHLPNWIVDVAFITVTGVALTFLISLFVLSPVKGFVLIFTGSRFFLHGVCPVLAMIAFCFFICDHRIRLWETFLALIPVFLYSGLYVVMVVVIGESRGGWNDFYGFATRLPLWIPALLILPLTFGIATLLRLLHNRCCLRRRQKDAALYRQVYGSSDPLATVENMARSRKQELRMADIVIPSRVIGHIVDASNCGTSVEEACKRYLEVFLEHEP